MRLRFLILSCLLFPLVDSDGDGVYDVYEVEGCMDIGACNCLIEDQLYWEIPNNERI